MSESPQHLAADDPRRLTYVTPDEATVLEAYRAILAASGNPETIQLAYVAMPIARSLLEALGDSAEVRQTIQKAMADAAATAVSDTLARLTRERVQGVNEEVSQ